MKTKKTIGPTQRPNPVGFKPLSMRRLLGASGSARAAFAVPRMRELNH
jgi:hypothetical protein